MKLFSVLLIGSIVLSACSGNKVPQQKTLASRTQHIEGTCSGDKYCSACKNCKYCKHCAKEGGKCGVCK